MPWFLDLFSSRSQKKLQEVDTEKGLGAEEEEMINGMGIPAAELMQSIPGIDEVALFCFKNGLFSFLQIHAGDEFRTDDEVNSALFSGSKSILF